MTSLRARRVSCREVALAQAQENVQQTHNTEGLKNFWWLETYEGEYGPIRKAVMKMVFSGMCENLTACVILLNVVLVVYQTDQEAKCFPEYEDDPFACPTNGLNI